MLVNASGRTLYRYTPDKKGKSTCSGQCAAYWPALMAKGKVTAGAGASASLVGTIKRGKSLQVTYAGWPLYTYVGDTKAGQMTGEGTEKIWYVVSPTGALVKKAVAGHEHDHAGNDDVLGRFGLGLGVTASAVATPRTDR